MIKDSLDFLFYGFLAVVIGGPFSLFCKFRDKFKGDILRKGKCESCSFFIPSVTIVDDGFVTYGYGCEYGGGFLGKRVFWFGCKDFKISGRVIKR